MIYGVDISNYQGNISDLGSDIDFVIIKVTEGQSYVNPYWTEQRDKARADGKIVLYYHFSDLTDATAEANHFLSTIGTPNTGEGLALDWETGNYSDATDDMCAQFITVCKQALNTVAMLYSNAARINSGAWPRVLALHAPLWEAAYSSTAPSPSPFPVITIWQNTSSGTEQGISGAVDRDQFSGTRDQLMQLGYNGGTEEMITKDDVGLARIIMSEVEGWDSTEVHSGKDDAQIMGAWEGKNVKDMVWSCWKATGTHRGDLATQITNLDNQITALKQQLGTSTNTDPNNIVITTKGWTGLYAAIKSFFGRNN